MIKKLVLLTLISAFLLTVLGSASAQVLFRDKKMYGPVPGMSININVGFIDGSDATHLTDYLDDWPLLQIHSSCIFDKLSVSPYMQIGYEYRIAPQFFLTTKFNLSYLKTEGNGSYIKNDTIPLDIHRELRIYLLSLDFGLKHYFSKPMPRTVCPYLAGGFSAVLPMVRLDTDSYNNGEPYYNNPEETVSNNSLVVGAHVEFGLNYFITNRFSAGIEARFQMCQSDIEIHDANFDLKYAAFNLALSFSHHF